MTHDAYKQQKPLQNTQMKTKEDPFLIKKQEHCTVIGSCKE